MLLKAGAHVNTKNMYITNIICSLGRTPLHLAIEPLFQEKDIDVTDKKE